MDYPSPSPPPSANLRPLLIIMGVLMCLVGLGCGGLMGLYMMFMPFLMAGMSSGLPEDPEMAQMSGMFEEFTAFYIIIGLFYILMGALTVWLGIGLIQCRRWSWKLSLSLGWFLIGMVVLMTVSYSFLAPGFMEAIGNMTTPPPAPVGSPASAPPATPGSSMGLMMVVGVVFALLFYSTPGLVLIIVFSLRNVRLTCESRDSVPRWTDRVPVPVLILWLFFFLMIPGLLIAIPGYGGMGPMKMGDLSPAMSIALGLLGAVLAAVAALGISRMKLSGWIIGFITCLLTGIMTTLLMRDYSMASMFEGMPTQAAEMTEFYRQLDNLPFWQTTIVFFGLVLVYMLFTLRYFRNRSSIATGPRDAGNPYNPPAIT